MNQMQDLPDWFLEHSPRSADTSNANYRAGARDMLTVIKEHHAKVLLAHAKDLQSQALANRHEASKWQREAKRLRRQLSGGASEHEDT